MYLLRWHLQPRTHSGLLQPAPCTQTVVWLRSHTGTVAANPFSCAVVESPSDGAWAAASLTHQQYLILILHLLWLELKQHRPLCPYEIDTWLRKTSLRQTQGKKEWGFAVRNQKTFFDITKMHLRLHTLRKPHILSLTNLLKGHKHFDITSHSSNQHTEGTRTCCGFLHAFYAEFQLLSSPYTEEQSESSLNCSASAVNKTIHLLQSTAPSITATAAHSSAWDGWLLHMPHHKLTDTVPGSG